MLLLLLLLPPPPVLLLTRLDRHRSPQAVPEGRSSPSAAHLRSQGAVGMRRGTSAPPTQFYTHRHATAPHMRSGASKSQMDTAAVCSALHGDERAECPSQVAWFSDDRHAARHVKGGVISLLLGSSLLTKRAPMLCEFEPFRPGPLRVVAVRDHTPAHQLYPVSATEHNTNTQCSRVRAEAWAVGAVTVRLGEDVRRSDRTTFHDRAVSRSS